MQLLLLLQLRYFALVLITLHWAACAWALVAALELGGALAAQEAAAQRGNATTAAAVSSSALAWTAVPTDPLSPEVPPQGAWQLYVRSLARHD
jgi:hypothetical protein